MDFSALSESLKGNTNAAGKHMMKLGSSMLDAGKSGVNDLSNIAKDLATKSSSALVAGKQKIAETTDHAVASVGHGLHQAALAAHAKASNLQSKIGANASALTAGVKAKAAEVQSKATPVLHHASGEMTKASQGIATKYNNAKAAVNGKISSTEAQLMQKLWATTPFETGQKNSKGVPIYHASEKSERAMTSMYQRESRALDEGAARNKIETAAAEKAGAIKAAESRDALRRSEKSYKRPDELFSLKSENSSTGTKRFMSRDGSGLKAQAIDYVWRKGTGRI
jgi:hypothetical protein